MHEEDLQDEVRDVLEDYPGLYNKVKAEETGSVLKRELCLNQGLKKTCFFFKKNQINQV